MVDLQAYLQALITALRRAYGERLVYVGLQGSYLRGEAGEDSDVDVMTVIEALSPSDLRRYRALLETLGIRDKACGFLCGRDELRHWNRCTRRATASACWPSFFRPSRRRIRGNSYG